MCRREGLRLAAQRAKESAGRLCAKAGRNSMPGNKLLCRFSKSAVPPAASMTGEPKNMEATEAASPVEPWARLGGAPEPLLKAGTAACSNWPAAWSGGAPDSSRGTATPYCEEKPGRTDG